MSRTITTAAKNASQAAQVTLATFVELEFSGGTVRAWSGVGDISWDGKTWSGLGQYGKISPISESQETRAAGVQLELTGVPSELISVMLEQTYQGRAARVWEAFFDASDAIIDDPVAVFAGRMDDSSISIGPTEGVITLRVENHLADLERARDFRWTDADQQRLFPGDKALEYIATISEKELSFGS